MSCRNSTYVGQLECFALRTKCFPSDLAVGPRSFLRVLEPPVQPAQLNPANLTRDILVLNELKRNDSFSLPGTSTVSISRQFPTTIPRGDKVLHRNYWTLKRSKLCPAATAFRYDLGTFTRQVEFTTVTYSQSACLVLSIISVDISN